MGAADVDEGGAGAPPLPEGGGGRPAKKRAGRRPHPPEVKARVLELLKAPGANRGAIARELGLSYQTVAGWAVACPRRDPSKGKKKAKGGVKHRLPEPIVREIVSAKRRIPAGA